MLSLSHNAVLVSLADRNDSEIEAAVSSRVAQIVDALRKRRARRWDKALGRRADGRVIRPIRTDGRRFTFGPVMPADQLASLRARVRRQVVEATPCESCGDAGRASFVLKPWSTTEYWQATLCHHCERDLNSPACQRDIYADEIRRCERRAGWVA